MSILNDKTHVLGCDIGNGYAYVSLILDPEKDPMPLFPSPYNLDGFGMPTTAYVKPPTGEKIEVFNDGRSADERYRSNPENLIRAVKTRLKEKTIKISGIENSIEVGKIYGAVVRDLLTLAEEELSNKSMEPIYDVVFTFPAIFSDDFRILESMQQNIENIAINGKKIRVVGRLPEPAAVAIDYLHYMQHIAPEDIRIKETQFTVLVYDLGHGTFDTAIVTAKSQGIPYKLHLKTGLPDIGGKNFDEILYNEILSELKEQYNFVPQNERKREEIRREAVKAKISLTRDLRYTASILDNKAEFCLINITRERFEQLSQHLILQTLDLVQDILDQASEKKIRIDCVVLSGGASKMPMVKKNLLEMLDNLKKDYPIVLYRPSEAVSFGAARFAYGIQDNLNFKEDVEFKLSKAVNNQVMCCPAN